MMLRKTATSCISQSLKCHIRIPDPSVELLQKKLPGFILHFVAFSSPFTFSHGFFFFCLSPWSFWELFFYCFPSAFQECKSFPPLSQDCVGFDFIPAQVTASQPTPIRQVEPEITEQTCSPCVAVLSRTLTHNWRLKAVEQYILIYLWQPLTCLSADTLSQNESGTGGIK